MKKILQDIQWVILFLIVWVIMYEKINLSTLIGGVLVGVFSLFFPEKYFIGGSYYKLYPLNILWSIKYGFFLLLEIYKASFYTIKMTISGDINPGIVEIKTNLKHDFHINILANSITLTPGTVTIDKKGQLLKVLWLDVKTKDPKEAAKIIKGSLEKLY